jgi:hypothetical protein
VTWLAAGTFDLDALAMAQRFVQRRNAEVLFARVVALYEGHTEDAAIPILARSFFGAGGAVHGVSFVNVEGANSHKHVVLLLEQLGIPWVILADNDPAGVGGLGMLETALARPLRADEIERLPAGMDFEKAVLAEGLRPHVESAIASFFGATALADHKTNRHGTALSGGGVRDFASAGWEDRLVLDFMGANKGLYGTALASTLVSASIIPNFAKQFFAKVQARLSPPAPAPPPPAPSAAPPPPPAPPPPGAGTLS